MRTRTEDLEWIGFAIAAAVAAHFVATAGSPIDQSLPFVAALLGACGWIAGARLVQLSAPLLLAAAMFLPEERMRLLAYGVVAAAAFAWAARVPNAECRVPSVALVVPGVMLLRWIPLGGVPVWRELIVLLGALAVAAAARREGSAAILAALAVALVTPIHPARLLLFPFVIAGLMLLPVPRIAFAAAFALVAYFARYSIATVCVAAAFAFLAVSLPLVRVPLYAVAIALFAFWPWSGIVARAMPRFLTAEPPSSGERPVWVALEAGRSVSIDAPPGAHRVVLTASGANAARLRDGRVVGWAEVVGRSRNVMRRALRIGDLADFGFTRSEHFFASRNPIPRTPLNDIKGCGIAAWLHTAGRIELLSADPIAALRVTAAPDLPPNAKLQVEAIEFE